MDSLDFQFAPLVSTLIATEAILFLAHVVDCTQDIRGSLSVKKIKKNVMNGEMQILRGERSDKEGTEQEEQIINERRIEGNTL